MIMEWLVTSKLYAIAAEDSKKRCNLKSLFWNHLPVLCPQKPVQHPSLAIHSLITDTWRVVRLMQLYDADSSIFLS